MPELVDQNNPDALRLQEIARGAEDEAMSSDQYNRGMIEKDKGGINFTANKTPLEIQNAGESIKFHIDPIQLAHLQNASGFVPVIISIQPVKDLKAFLVSV